MAKKWWPCPECCAGSSSSAGQPDHPWGCCPSGSWPDCITVDVSGIIKSSGGGIFDSPCDHCPDLNGTYFLNYTTLPDAPPFPCGFVTPDTTFVDYYLQFTPVCCDHTFELPNALCASEMLLTIQCTGFRDVDGNLFIVFRFHLKISAASPGCYAELFWDVDADPIGPVGPDTDCLAALFGATLLPPGIGDGAFCGEAADSQATLNPCGGPVQCDCCGDTELPPALTADISGLVTGGCWGSDSFEWPGLNFYMPEWIYNGSNTVGAGCKWVHNFGGFGAALVLSCPDGVVQLQFILYQAISPTLTYLYVWEGTTDAGCTLDGVTLSFVTTDNPATGCAADSAASLVMLHA